jgi:predicted transcriptional regulator
VNHSLRVLREAADLGQRELSRRTQIPQAKLSRAEAGEIELSRTA